MKRCLQLAELGAGQVQSNPLVGCVIVLEGKILGEGYHHAFGQAHAEVEAIARILDHNALKNSTLYVNLEPCSHHGKTPPCANLIIKSGISKVVICNTDPHEKVAGKGIRKLRDAGIEVEVGILEMEGRFLNRKFFTFHEKSRPYVTLKWAQTIDGFIGRSDEQNHLYKSISNSLSNILVHQLRASHQAILIGNVTANFDNPKLNVRHWFGSSPVRIILDKENILRSDLALFTDGGKNLIFTKSAEKKGRPNTTFVFLNPNETIINQVFRYCHQADLQSILVEGGSKTLQHFIDEDAFDEVVKITSKQLWQEGIVAPRLETKSNSKSYYLGSDCIEITRKYS
jgi:diaminohydroxyphosphoribosylaminopyrimidine deaminase/5-amino-6-(5-phosphoribosylamino)uracil reductase